MEKLSEKTKNTQVGSPSGSIMFTPVTEGLGFHPFSDGLPYAPVSRSRPGQFGETALSGTGAVAAGRPSFARTLPAVPAGKVQTHPPGHGPRVTVPVAPLSVSLAPGSTPASVIVSPGLQTLATNASTQKNKQPVPNAPLPLSQELIKEERPGFFYITQRALAYVLDLLLSQLFFVGSLFAWQAWDPNSLADVLAPLTLEAFVLLAFVFHWIFVGTSEVLFLTSFGKKIFGLRIQGSRAAAFLRVFFFIPSLALLGVGVLWGLFDRRKRCLHDHLVDAQPMAIARLG